MNRVMAQAPPATPIKKTTKTETKAPQKPRKESYYLNELP
jgi:hypothetical protein